MIKYGLISETDARTLEKTIDLIIQEEKYFPLRITEVGVYSGETGNGIREYVKSKGGSVALTGIDNGSDKEPMRFKYDYMYYGNSNEVYNRLIDESQDIIFIDGNHSFPCTIADFFCYEAKVKVGGYLCFHDVGKHIKLFKDYQKMGSESDPDMYISCRKALDRIGLLADEMYGWRLIFDEADESNPAGGVAVFKKYVSLK